MQTTLSAQETLNYLISVKENLARLISDGNLSTEDGKALEVMYSATLKANSTIETSIKKSKSSEKDLATELNPRLESAKSEVEKAGYSIVATFSDTVVFKTADNEQEFSVYWQGGCFYAHTTVWNVSSSQWEAGSLSSNGETFFVIRSFVKRTIKFGY